MEHMVYVDNSATTKVSDSVFQAMLPYLKDIFGNAQHPCCGTGGGTGGQQSS